MASYTCLNIEALQQDLIAHEGLRLKPYRCTAGKLSIGVGRNLDDVGISKDEALVMLKNDIDRVLDNLDAHLPWWRQMSEPRQRALANMAFNMGIGRLLGFRKMIAALAAGQYDEAARQAKDSKWAEQVGTRDDDLVKMIKEG